MTFYIQISAKTFFWPLFKICRKYVTIFPATSLFILYSISIDKSIYTHNKDNHYNIKVKIF